MKKDFLRRIEKSCRNPFSLIELLIVVAIMGVLAALILPHFTTSESAAKDIVCDYNQAGTVRFINMFRTANGAYPSGFHTGLTAAGGVVSEMTGVEPTDTNFKRVASSALTANEALSLIKAGIINLAHGTGDGEDAGYGKLADPEMEGEPEEEVAVYPNVVRVTSSWIDDDEEELSFNGKSIDDVIAERGGVVIPLLVAPTIDWETAHVGGETEVESKVEIPLVGKCPWPEDGKMRYYVCFFWVDDTGERPARLLATSCPECGILAGNTF